MRMNMQETHGKAVLDEVPQVVVVRQGRKQVVCEVRNFPCSPYDGADEGEREQGR